MLLSKSEVMGRMYLHTAEAQFREDDVEKHGLKRWETSAGAELKAGAFPAARSFCHVCDLILVLGMS